ncbi:MAG: hypothetical protein AB1696_01410 [Planctomycetota bacterium]
MRPNACLPVTVVERVFEEKGVAQCRRGDGAVVARATIARKKQTDEFANVSRLRKVDGAKSSQLERAQRMADAVQDAMAHFESYLRAFPTGRKILAALRRQQSNIPIEFLDRHEWLIDTYPFDDPLNEAKPRIRFDIDASLRAAERAPDGLAPFLVMGLLHEFCHLLGQDEREALRPVVEFYQVVSDEDRSALNAFLSCPEIDAGDVFLRFLRESAGRDDNEIERQIARLRARTQVELPYNDADVRRALQEETEVGALRLRVYNAINDTYVPEIDAVNAERIGDWCLERGVRLVGGRFSRALYLDAMLMANADVLKGRNLQKSVSALASLVNHQTLQFRSAELQGESNAFLKVGGELQLLQNITARDAVSQAEVEGVIAKFISALREIESGIVARIDKLQSAKRDEIARECAGRKRSVILNALGRDREEVRKKVDGIASAMADVESNLANAPKREPVYLAYLQRLFELDAINLGTVNEFVDPFFGEDEHVHRLIRECGHNMYITSNLNAWLRQCRDWIEALPAYASYEIVPKEGGGYDVRAWVQRAILEIMYRRHAADWAENINRVMDSEHIAIARDILTEKMKLGRQVDLLMRKCDLSKEEASREVCKRKGLAREIANLAALIEATYLELCLDVAQCREKNDISRMEALRRIIHENRTGKNLVAPILKRSSGIPRALTMVMANHGLQSRAAHLLPTALKRRRKLPCVHVLTTLGPGETEFNVENWLEESMALYNVSKAHGLEPDVERRIDDYQRRLAAVGRRVVEELDLQGQLYTIMEEEGLNANDETARAEGVIKLVASYPEVAAEASALAVLIEHEESAGDRKSDPTDAAEPKCVTNYLAEHPEVETNAIQKVIENNELAGDVQRLARDEHISEDDAGRRVIETNATFCAEKESVRLSLARSAMVSALNLREQARNYMSRYLDRQLATVAVRRQIIAERGLSKELDNPRFRYEASGPFKKFHLLYTPSRVDLGASEVASVKNVSKWVGGLDREAANAGKELYSLYNVAGVTAVEETRLAEFLKVGENFFSRGGPFYLSLTAGVNIDTIRVGDFEFFRDQWNLRGDRIVLPAGETYGGFCVPKEFTLLHAIIFAAVRKETSTEILKNFGIPEEIHETIIADMRRALRMRTDATDDLDWQLKAARFLSERYPDYFAMTKAPACIARLPQLSGTFQRMGLIAPDAEEDRKAEYRFANWANRKALGMEEINRSGPFRKVHLIYRLIDEARKRNPHIAPNAKLIGAMSAPYKEGEREDGKEIPIADVRFSAGSRKLEIYAGTAADHLLKDVDPEGRDVISALLKNFSPPADIRIVGTCAGSDILNHVPKSGLEQIKDDVLAKLMAAGLDENMIAANCRVYGGDLEEWAGIKEMPEKKRRNLIAEIGGKIHLLVVDKRGTYQSYDDAVQGVDFVDLGIPDPGLLDLVDNLPKLLYLMRRGRPNSALVLADGTSGGRRRSFSYRYASSKRKVKELFALDDRVQYGALGLGSDTIAAWREEALADMALARQLYDDVVDGRVKDAEETHRRIADRLRRDDRALEAAREEINARRMKTLRPDYRYVSAAAANVSNGMPFLRLDFGTWLLLGGMYVLNGRLSAESIARRKAEFEGAMKKIAGRKYRPAFNDRDADAILGAFVRPVYTPPAEETFREVEAAIGGSLKATEEKVSRLEKREARRRQALRIGQLRLRKKEFESAEPEATRTGEAMGFDGLYAKAKSALGDGTSDVTQPAFGAFQAWARAASAALLRIVTPRRDGKDVTQRFSDFFSGGEISDEAYADLCADIARLAEAANGDTKLIEKTARTAELMDIAFVLEKTIGMDDAGAMMIEIARFFDATLNNHVFDYPPYHYHKHRGVGYESFTRQEIFALCAKTHRWLYTYIRSLMVNATVLRDRGVQYQDAWLGDADRDILPLGVHVDDPAQRFWFSYVRLRDASVLWHENFPMPEIFIGLDPNVIKAKERTNVVIVYPHGNTTVPVALEQGAKLAAGENMNLMLTAFPSMVNDARFGRETLHLYDAFMYIGAEDYRAALVASNVPKAEAAVRARSVGGNGVLIQAEFSRPVVAHAIFFHFTHPMRPEIGRLGVPLIQPIIWEAATHLKCRLPDMLKGSGIRTADQINWFQSDSAGQSEADAKREIRRRLTEFSKIAPTIIVKPEKESGGRRARILPVRRDGRLLTENIDDLADLIQEISQTDNAAIQNVIRSRVRQLYTREFLEDMVDRFARIGASVLLDRNPLTPLFSYFRQVLVLGKNGYEVSHNITVISTAGIANVGQGGLLYEYTDEIINRKYREDLRREIRKAAFNSMESQRKYVKENWRMVLEEYLAIHPEYRDRVEMRFGKDLTGFDDRDIPYEMGDYMPQFLVDESDNLVQIYDEDAELFLPLFDEQGRPTDAEVYDSKRKPIPRVGADGQPIPIPMFDEGGNRIQRYDRKKRPISTLVCLKIEPNPGAGLWRPHNDQLPPERKGEGVYTIFKCLGERGDIYRDKLNAMAQMAASAPQKKPSTYLAGLALSDAEPTINDAIDDAIAKAKEDLGRR